MKKLSISDMETVSGGLTDAQSFANGFCAGVGLVALFTPVAPLLGIGCAGYAIFSLF